MAMTEYQIDQKTHPGKTTVDDLVKNIKKIAFECTSRPECRCPEGYFKTRDGTECLKFSESTANCMEAEKACNADFNSRLAIAKDQERLDKIAGIMEEIAGEDEFYWIGLSYNKTSNNGDADWRWSDGNKASGNLTVHSLRIWYLLYILYFVYICTNIVMFVELGFSIES